jgi:hypothetical protein
MPKPDIEVTYAGKQHIFMIDGNVELLSDTQCRILAMAAAQFFSRKENDPELVRLVAIAMQIDPLQAVALLYAIRDLIEEGAKAVAEEALKNEGASTETKPAEVQTAG